MQKLKSHLLKTQSLKVLSLKPGVGQHIAIHTVLTAKDFSCLFLPFHSIHLHFFQTFPDFFPVLAACSGELRMQKFKVPSGENTELKRSPFKAWSRSVYSLTCYTYCHGFLPYFYPFHSFTCIFSKTSPNFSCVGCG